MIREKSKRKKKKKEQNRATNQIGLSKAKNEVNRGVFGRSTQITEEEFINTMATRNVRR